MNYEARFPTRKINDKIQNEKPAQNEKRIPWQLTAEAALKLKVSTPRENGRLHHLLEPSLLRGIKATINHSTCEKESSANSSNFDVTDLMF